MKRSSDGSAKKTSNQDQESWLGEDYELKIPDVFCGSRGSQDQENKHPGNKRFKVAVTLRLEQYKNAETKYDKSMIVKDIISSVHESGGRFVRQKNGKWYDVGLPKARDKVTTAIRLMLGLKNKIKEPPTEAKAVMPTDTSSADLTFHSGYAFQTGGESRLQVISQAPAAAGDAKVTTFRGETEPFQLAGGDLQQSLAARGLQPNMGQHFTVDPRRASNQNEENPQFTSYKQSTESQAGLSSDHASLGFLPPAPGQWTAPSSPNPQDRGPPFQSASLVAELDQQYQIDGVEGQQSPNDEASGSVSVDVTNYLSLSNQKISTSEVAKEAYIAPLTEKGPTISSKDSHISNDDTKSSEETSSFERSVARRTFTPSSESNTDSNEESTGKAGLPPDPTPHDSSPDSLVSLDKKPPAV